MDFFQNNFDTGCRLAARFSYQVRFPSRAKPWAGRTVADLLKDGEIALVFNSTEGTAAVEDSREIRAIALNDRIPYYTTLSGSHAAALAMKAKVEGDVKVRALQG